MQYFQIEELDKAIEQCFIDKTTKLNNLTGLSYIATHILKQHKRYEENWSLVVFDTNIEKYVRAECDNINQTDINLAVAKTLTDICRQSDILAFCGNSTFCILSRVFEGDDTVRFANKILKHITNIQYKDCKIEINTQFGITFSKYEDSTQNFFKRAESALLKAQSSKESVVVSA